MHVPRVLHLTVPALAAQLTAGFGDEAAAGGTPSGVAGVTGVVWGGGASCAAAADTVIVTTNHAHTPKESGFKAGSDRRTSAKAVARWLD